MSEPFDLVRLFEIRKPPKPLYPTLAAELDAIKLGKKQMSMFWPRSRDLDDPASYHFQVLHAAFERDLAVTIHGEPTGDKREPMWLTVFVAKREQLWRVPALLAIEEAKRTRGIDNESSQRALEWQRSMLLGYTTAQSKAWFALMHQRDSSSVYVLLTRAQKTRVVSLGQRSLGTPEEIQAMTFFFHRCGIVKGDAARLVPKSLTLARVRVSWRMGWQAWFPDWGMPHMHRLLHTTKLSREHAQMLNDTLESRIEFMTSRGWQ